MEAEEVVVTLDADEDLVIDADDAAKKTLSSNCFDWYVGDKDEEGDGGELLARYFLGYSNGSDATEKKTFESEHYATDGKVTISENYNGSYAYDPHYTSSHCTNTGSARKKDDKEKKYTYGPIKPSFDAGVSTNVLQLDDKTFLFVAYKLDGRVASQIGTNTPVVPFNGMKYDDATKDPDNGKIKKNNYAIWVDAALVTQEAGEAPKLITNTLSSNLKGKDVMTVKITPKNNINANVSGNSVKDEKGNYAGFPAIKNPWYKKDTDHPYFTISVTIKADKNNKALSDAVKVFNKNKNKAKNQQSVEGLNKTEFKFDICQNSFARFTHTNLNTGEKTISAADIQKNASGVQSHYDDYDYTTNETLGFRHLYPFPNYKDADNDLGENPLDNRDIISFRDDEYGLPDSYHTHWIGQRTLTTDGGIDVGTIDLFTDAKKAGKNNIPVYLVNATGEYDATMNTSGWNLKKKFATYKLKKGKDYTVEPLEGVENAIVLLPTGNFDPYSDGVIFRNAEYTLPAGYGSLTKEKKVTELRVGIYNTANKNFYVDSVD